MTNHFVLNRREHFYMYTNRISAIVSIVLTSKRDRHFVF